LAIIYGNEKDIDNTSDYFNELFKKRV